MLPSLDSFMKIKFKFIRQKSDISIVLNVSEITRKSRQNLGSFLTIIFLIRNTQSIKLWDEICYIRLLSLFSIPVYRFVWLKCQNDLTFPGLLLNQHHFLTNALQMNDEEYVV